MQPVPKVAPPAEIEQTPLVAIVRRTEPMLACETVEALPGAQAHGTA
jgi:hypothetical protein